MAVTITTYTGEIYKMSKTTDRYQLLLEKAETVHTLHDVLELDLLFYNCNGTPMNIQNYLGALKNRIANDVINKHGLGDCYINLFNYSMRGSCQLLFDEYDRERVYSKLEDLEKDFDLKIIVDERKDTIVLNCTIPEANL